MSHVLITCAGGAGSLYMAKSLQKKHQVYLADGNDRVAKRTDLPFQCIPFGSDPSFSTEIRALAEKWDIDYIVPGADEELLPLASLHEKGVVRCVIPTKEFIEMCLNKKTLMHSLHEHGISSLLPFEDREDIHYPVIVKPIYGRGSREVHRVETADQIDGYQKLYKKKPSDILIQPYIEGTEYTVSVIVNNHNRIIGIVPKRIIEKRGITRAAITEKNVSIEDTCTRIVEQFHPQGPFNAQLVMKENVCFIFEINPRLSTTAVLTERSFGNEIELYIEHNDQKELSNLPTMKENILMLRYEEHYFSS